MVNPRTAVLRYSTLTAVVSPRTTEREENDKCNNNFVLILNIGKITLTIDMSLAVIKFSSEDCGICHKMSFYDHKVAKELDLDFIDVKMQDTATYRKYRKILLSQYPNKEEMGWPTYLICDSPEEDFQILGEVKGGHPKGEFRQRLKAVLESN